MAGKTVSEAELFVLSGLLSNSSTPIEQIVNAAFVPRIVDEPGTTLTVLETHRGAIIRFTSGSAITVTLPSSLPTGFLVSFLPYGAGVVTFSGSAFGGTGSAGQYKICSAMKMDGGEWLISGGA